MKTTAEKAQENLEKFNQLIAELKEYTPEHIESYIWVSLQEDPTADVPALRKMFREIKEGKYG